MLHSLLIIVRLYSKKWIKKYDKCVNPNTDRLNKKVCLAKIHSLNWKMWVLRFRRMNDNILRRRCALLPFQLPWNDGDFVSANVTRIPKISGGESGFDTIFRFCNSSITFLTTSLDGVGVSDLFICDRERFCEIFGGNDLNLFLVSYQKL